MVQTVMHIFLKIILLLALHTHAGNKTLMAAVIGNTHLIIGFGVMNTPSDGSEFFLFIMFCIMF